MFEELIQGEFAKENNITLDKLKAMSIAQGMAWRWLMFIEDTERKAQKLDNCLIIKYEDICAKPAEKFEQLCSFYGLSFDKQVKKYVSATTHAFDDDFYSIKKYPLIASQKWKKELSEEEITEIVSVIQSTSSGRKYL